jgi:hypothetical protein
VFPGGGHSVRWFMVKMTSDFMLLSEHSDDRVVHYESMTLVNGYIYAVGNGDSQAVIRYTMTRWDTQTMQEQTVGLEHFLDADFFTEHDLFAVTHSPTHIYALGYTEYTKIDTGSFTGWKLLLCRFGLDMSLQAAKVIAPFTLSNRFFGLPSAIRYDSQTETLFVAANHGNNTLDITQQTSVSAYAANSLIMQVSTDLELVNHNGFDSEFNGSFSSVDVDDDRLFITGRIRQNPEYSSFFPTLIIGGDDVGTVTRWNKNLLGNSPVPGTHDGLTVTPDKDPTLALVNYPGLVVGSAPVSATQTNFLTLVDTLFPVFDKTQTARDSLRPQGGLFN